MADYVRIPAIQQSQRAVDGDGRFDPAVLRALNTAFQQLVDALNGIASLPGIQDAIQAAQDAADAANAAAENAQNVADATTAEQSLNTSYVANFTPPLLSVDSTGSVTIANHDRVYGDSALNPTVAVTGGTFPSGFAAGDNVRVFYDDPTRAGGAVTYAFSLDPADAAQTGARHSVGAVIIPNTGTEPGFEVLPPGGIYLQ